MTTLVKLIIGFSLALFSFFYENYAPKNDRITLATVSPEDLHANTSKENAFQIFENKCNDSHCERYKKWIFTPATGNFWVKEGDAVLLLKKRMSMGKKIKRNSREYTESLKWITTTQHQY